MAARVGVRGCGIGAVEAAEGAQAVQPHEVRLPMVGLDARGLIECAERLLVLALPDAHLGEQQVREGRGSPRASASRCAQRRRSTRAGR